MTKIVLGTMNICYPHSSNSSNEEYSKIIHEYIKIFGSNSYLDTAYYYGNSKTESVLGEILDNPNLIQPKIATKVNPWFENDFSTGKLGQLSKDGILHQFNTSLKNLRLNKIDILYLHSPDYETPITETIDTMDSLYRTEKINHWGVSNYSKPLLNDIITICQDKGYIMPSYYQGMYNPICRKIESIFPVLDEHNIEFWGYNPLAGGLLTSKYKSNDEINKKNRFNNNKIYNNIFWKAPIIDAINKFYPDIVETSIDQTFSWLMNHSYCSERFNKIVIGVSSVNQLNQNLNSIYNYRCLTNSELNNFNVMYKSIVNHTPNYYY